MVDYKDLGIRVRKLRRQSGLTQEELAEQVGISTSFLGHIERGSRVASLDTMVAICNTLLVTPQQLLSASLKPVLAQDLPFDLSPEACRKLGNYLLDTSDRLDAGKAPVELE